MEKVKVVTTSLGRQRELKYLHDFAQKYRNIITPQSRKITEIDTYISEKYPLIEKTEKELIEVGRYNLIGKHIQNKQKQNQAMDLPLDQVRCFEILNEGNGKQLYANQSTDYEKLDAKYTKLLGNQYHSFLPIESTPIYIWLDSHFNDYQIEGSPSLNNELKLLFGITEIEVSEDITMYDYVKLLVEHEALPNITEEFWF